MNLNKIRLIALREYLYNIRRRAYLFTAFVIPIVSFGLTAISSNFANGQFTDTGNFQHVGIVDSANIMGGISLPAPYQRIASADAAAVALKAGTLDMYYVLPTDYLSNGNVESFSRASVAPGLDAQFEKFVRQALASKLSNTTTLQRLQNPLPDSIPIRKLGSDQVYDESVMFSALLLPLVFGMLLFLSITTTSQFLMSGVVEEKENRMMELLMTSSRPSEMLWGKIIGLGALGLTQMIIWGALGFAYATLQGTANLSSTLANLQVTPGLLLLMIAYFLLGYLLFGAIMAGLGASVNAEAESRQLAGIFGFVTVLPFILFLSFLNDSNSAVPVALSMFPLTAPLSMILRVSFGIVPGWQIALSLLILAGGAVAAIWISARVFRLGMLSYGKRLSIRDVIGAFREGRHILTTTNTPKEANAS